MIPRSVEFALGDVEYSLTPTLAALMAINKRHGSLRECFLRIASIDVDAMFQLVRDGAGLSASGFKRMQEDAVLNGIRKLHEPCAQYLELLMGADDVAEDSDAGKA